MTHLNDNWIGYFHEANDFTPASLRDYYRYCGSQLVLCGIERGVTLDPSSYMWGRQIELEMAAIMVESTVLGRQVVHGAKVNEPLRVRGAGKGFDTFLVVGNTKPVAHKTDVTVHRRYFPAAPIFAEYYGQETIHRVHCATSQIADLTVQPRDVAAFKAVAMWRGNGKAGVTSRLGGDGITMQLDLEIRAAPGSELTLSEFGPLYEIIEVKANDRAVTYDPFRPLRIEQANTKLRVSYRNRSLAFSAADWKRVELIKDGKVNFCLVADKGIIYAVDPEKPQQKFLIGFERGTANMLNEFLEMYDDDDGIPGNLGAAEYKDKRPHGYEGWSVMLRQDPMVLTGRVRIEPDARHIVVEGAIQGEIRRAMTVFLRLVDRKYPHVGRHYPFRYRKQFYVAGEPVPFDKWVTRAKTRDFYKAFSDPKFLVKPILRPEYESLGIEKPGEVDGMSLLPTLRGEAQVTDQRHLFWMRRNSERLPNLPYYVARHGDFKLLQNNPNERFQLFNLKDDPGERQPLDESHEMHGKLTEALRDHITRSGAVPWQKPGGALPAARSGESE